MNDFNNELYYAAKEEMNRRIPYRDMDYRNDVVASIIAQGHADKLTTDWVMRALLEDVEDGFLTYGQAVYIKDEYYKAICIVKTMAIGIG